MCNVKLQLHANELILIKGEVAKHLKNILSKFSICLKEETVFSISILNQHLSDVKSIFAENLRA